MSKVLGRFAIVVAVAALMTAGAAWAQEGGSDILVTTHWGYLAETGGGITGVAGSEYVIFVDVYNGGPDDAENIIVQDFMPAGVSVTAINWVEQGNVMAGEPGNPFRPFVWNVGHLDPFATTHLEVLVLIDPAVPEGTILWNDAQATCDDDDITHNNVDTTFLYVDTVADLSLELFQVMYYEDPLAYEGDGYYDFLAGDIATYVIEVANYGPSVSRQVKVLDALFGEMQVLNVQVVGGNSNPALISESDDGFWNLLYIDLGDIAPVPEQFIGAPGAEQATVNVSDNGRRTIFVTVKVAGDMWFYEGYVENYAVVISGDLDQLQQQPLDAPKEGQPPLIIIDGTLFDTYDYNTDNNWAFLETGVFGAADVAIVKTVDPLKAYLGQQLTYTLTVTNYGPSDAFYVSVYDDLPYGVTFESVSTVQYFGVNGSQIWWGIEYLPAGASETITVKVLLSSDPAFIGQTIFNYAYVYPNDYPGAKAKGMAAAVEGDGPFFDWNPANDSSVAAFLVLASDKPDLVAVWKKLKLSNKDRTQNAVLRVKNQGTRVAGQFQVAVALVPDGVKTMPKNPKTVLIKSLAPGASIDIPFTFTVSGKGTVYDYYLLGVVDTRDTVKEGIESNNVATYGEN